MSVGAGVFCETGLGFVPVDCSQRRVSTSCDRNRGTPWSSTCGENSGTTVVALAGLGNDLFATFALQRLINSLRFDVMKSWSIWKPYLIAPYRDRALPNMGSLFLANLCPATGRVCRESTCPPCGGTPFNPSVPHDSPESHYPGPEGIQ